MKLTVDKREFPADKQDYPVDKSETYQVFAEPETDTGRRYKLASGRTRKEAVAAAEAILEGLLQLHKMPITERIVFPLDDLTTDIRVFAAVEAGRYVVLHPQGHAVTLESMVQTAEATVAAMQQHANPPETVHMYQRADTGAELRLSSKCRYIQPKAAGEATLVEVRFCPEFFAVVRPGVDVVRELVKRNP